MVIDIKNLHNSKVFHGILIGIVSLIVLMVVFQAGIFVGYHKAAFSYSGGDNYYRVFRRGPGVDGSSTGMGMMATFDQDDLQGGHGAVGKIVKINLPTLVIADIKNTEKTILINDDTIIRRYRDSIPASGITLGEMAIVLGTPDNNGEIDAKLVRILPPPPAEFIASTTMIISATSTNK